jgi:hypothetical protein
VGGNPDGICSLAKYSRLPADRIRNVPDADAATVRSIGRGVLFLMAFWSGPSVQAFATLTEVLARLDAGGLEFVVADVDGSPDLYELPEFKGKGPRSGRDGLGAGREDHRHVGPRLEYRLLRAEHGGVAVAAVTALAGRRRDGRWGRM